MVCFLSVKLSEPDRRRLRGADHFGVRIVNWYTCCFIPSCYPRVCRTREYNRDLANGELLSLHSGVLRRSSERRSGRLN